MDPKIVIDLAGRAASLQAETVKSTQERFHQMMWDGGPGLTFFTVGFVFLITAMVLRISDSGDFTVDAFLGLLAVGVSCLAMAWVYFLVNLRAQGQLGQAAINQNDKVIAALSAVLTGNVEMAREAQEQVTRGGLPKPKGEGA